MSDLSVIDSWEKNCRGENVRVALDVFRGARLVDVRVTVDLSAISKVQTPTPKGIALKVEHLPRLIAALQNAQTKAQELGWFE